MKYKIITAVICMLIAQLSACQMKDLKSDKKKENMNEEKIEWDGMVCTPKGYPATVLSPNVFYSSGGKYITLIPNMSYTGGSDWTGSARSWASEPKPAPDHLSITWFSETENKIYAGEFALPQQKIYNLFKEGYMDYGIPNDSDDGKETLHWETYSSLTVGLAPKGMVVVWINGQNKVEIGRYQARELDRKEANEVFKRHFKSSGDMPETIDKSEFDRLTPEVKEIIKQGKISCKQWDDYRLRYNWKVEFNKPLEMYHHYIGFFNSEYTRCLAPKMSEEEFNKTILEPSDKIVPNKLGMYLTAQNHRNYLIRLETLDEQETIEAFKKLEEASPKAVITIFITVDDDFKSFTVTLKNDKKEIKLEKALLRLFTLDKSNDLKNQK
ncbi:DUF2931 family protein [Flavobacterium sp. CFBP9031]|uniref:DUF2931 family protein n=1 Tax=Flavobacterium sp. CFBP9031 TaxID=3096538 RepID=UPI002A69C6C9|nr:DUF2931 family protein [Flavobacterium sp. CFBP9031]MDY0990515.1 DUF2931 family protein [Flavobacterium sp. CFBP9031]